MQRSLYAVWDEKACFFGIPFPSLTHAEAIRSFSDGVADPQTRLSLHPSDYVLYNVGAFDDVSGSLLPLDKPVYLARASDFIKPSQPIE